MDQHMFQLIAGMASAEKIGQEFRPKTPFSQFDVLDRDEPIWAWQFKKRLLSVPHNILTLRIDQKSSDGIESNIQISVQ